MKTLSKITLIAALCFLFPLSGCADKKAPLSRTGFYFDTVISVTLYGGTKEDLDGCFALAEKYEKLFSPTVEGSDVWNINHAGGQPVTVSGETLSLLVTLQDYVNQTEGALDPTIRPVSALWDFGGEAPRVPEDAAIKEALSHVSFDALRFGVDSASALAPNTVTLADEKAAIDFGCIAKGYIADNMRDYLLSQGVKSACVNLGGNVLVIGEKPDGSPFRIGIQKPFSQAGESIATAKLKDASLVTSGIYERCFEENGKLYHHVLNTKTGYPVDNTLASATILCASSTKADALSTACLAMGLEKGRAFLEGFSDVEYLLIDKDGQTYSSDRFPVK